MDNPFTFGSSTSLFAFFILSPCLRGTSDVVAEGVYCVFVFFGRTHRSAPTAGCWRSLKSLRILGSLRSLWPNLCIFRAVCREYRCVCPLLFAVYILFPCLRGTSDGVAEGVNMTFVLFGRTHRSAPTGTSDGVAEGVKMCVRAYCFPEFYPSACGTSPRL